MSTLQNTLLELADTLEAQTGEPFDLPADDSGVCDGCAGPARRVKGYRLDGPEEPWLCAECSVEHEAPLRQAIMLREMVVLAAADTGKCTGVNCGGCTAGRALAIVARAYMTPEAVRAHLAG